MSDLDPDHDGQNPTKDNDVVLTKNQTIVDTIKAPRLRDVTYLHFIKFKKARENYEREVLEKNKDPGVNITLASYATSVDHNVLEQFIDRQYIQRESVADVTEEDLLDCINRRCERPKGEFELSDVEKAIKSVRLDMSILGAEPGIDTLVLAYKRALEASGYSNFTRECPKIAIGHIHDRLKPSILKDMMEDEFEKQHSKGLHKKDFRYFISELVRLAEIVEKTSSRRGHSHGDKDGKKPDRKNGRRDKPSGKEGKSGRNNKRTERPAPLCLYH
ncbi:unnamed protein product [Agarophyton chilense]|eukprot:gb/GEZJ01002943.1/.p2 GENE.gb/GEZJ01002943.1/~~gb/GEZJ01002943.1/.p2  ORF type:complete len:274 (-),score=28.63 gb/GEZJ01002943.1/:577-1398(-)